MAEEQTPKALIFNSNLDLNIWKGSFDLKKSTFSTYHEKAEEGILLKTAWSGI